MIGFKRIFLSTVLLFYCFFNSNEIKAQDPQFGHFYSNSLLYNPAFTGNTDLGRFALGYRNQWPGLRGAFISYSFSYDHFFSKIKSGVGVQFVNDKAGSGGLTTTGANFMYSYQIPISSQTAILTGIKAGYQSRYYDFNRFTFADQIVRDNAPASITNEFRDRISYFNFGQGIVFYHIEKYWFGLSFDHLNNPENSFGDRQSNLPVRFALQGGWNFKVNPTSSGRARSTITAAFLYKTQQKWDQLDLGAYYKVNPFIVGLWYRGLPLKSNESSIQNADAIMLLTGYEYDRITFAYSYEITISPLASNTNGAHEVSLILNYPKSKKRRRRYYKIPCPKF